jgi:hypothetical protein
MYGYVSHPPDLTSSEVSSNTSISHSFSARHSVLPPTSSYCISQRATPHHPPGEGKYTRTCHSIMPTSSHPNTIPPSPISVLPNALQTNHSVLYSQASMDPQAMTAPSHDMSDDEGSVSSDDEGTVSSDTEGISTPELNEIVARIHSQIRGGEDGQ